MRLVIKIPPMLYGRIGGKERPGLDLFNVPVAKEAAMTAAADGPDVFQSLVDVETLDCFMAERNSWIGAKFRG